MLIKFSCEEYENIIMFGDIAKKLITLMGHSPTVPGAIRAADIPDALSHLKNGIEQTAAMKQTNQDDNEDEPVSLKHRAIPLIKMLEAAAKNNKPIMWE